MLQKFLLELHSKFPAHPLKTVNHSLGEIAQKHLDSLTKPQGSLGLLEKIARRLFIINNGSGQLSVDPAMMFIIAADHGVAVQKVSPFPQAVTRQMVFNFLNEGAAINALCSVNNIDLTIVDAGCQGDPFQPHSLLLNKRIANATQDFTQSQAMTEEECLKALLTGFDLGLKASEKYACICTGEMGIANSTSAAALFCAYLDLPPVTIAGPGAGANSSMLAHKKNIIRQALEKHSFTIKSKDPVAILATLGGFEIAMLAGLMLSCASTSTPFLVDGYICTAAYLAALQIYQPLKDYSFLAHYSAEPAYKQIISHPQINETALLDLSLRLGEGTGCALALPILRAACAIYNNMATLRDAQVSATEEDRID